METAEIAIENLPQVAIKCQLEVGGGGRWGLPPTATHTPRENVQLNKNQSALRYQPTSLAAVEEGIALTEWLCPFCPSGAWHLHLVAGQMRNWFMQQTFMVQIRSEREQSRVPRVEHLPKARLRLTGRDFRNVRLVHWQKKGEWLEWGVALLHKPRS